MSDEFNVGHYFKRIAAINVQFGDPTYHLMRYAQQDEVQCRFRRGPQGRVQPEVTRMTDAVIVSTARTPIGKAYRGAFNDTDGATLLGHAIARRCRGRRSIPPRSRTW